MILPSEVPMTFDISTLSVEMVISVAYNFISLWTRLLGPGTEVDEIPMRRTEIGVQITRRCVISSTKTPGLGLTTATCEMTSGWSAYELISCLEKRLD